MAIRELARDDEGVAQVVTDLLRRPEIAFKAMRDAEAQKNVNEAQFEQAGLHTPAHCGPPLTTAIAATGIVVALAVAARGQDTGAPPPRTPHGATGRDPPDLSYPNAEGVRDARPAPMSTDPRAGGARQSPP
ncbi:DUF6192 family protein [Streptomyces sp. NPDC001868]|uniref:DUF6192 family protein n=1 Tax=Streptomyces sp. NPDC001868 TaxID=3154401 RepID=UPI0033315EFD